MEVIITPFAKFVFLLCMPKKNNGKLISALILIRPPNFPCLNNEKIAFSMGPSEKYRMIKIIALELAKKLEITP